MKAYLILIAALFSASAFGHPGNGGAFKDGKAHGHNHGHHGRNMKADWIPRFGMPSWGKREDDQDKNVYYLANCSNANPYYLLLYSDFSKSYDPKNEPTFREALQYVVDTFKLAASSGHQDSGFEATFKDLGASWYGIDNGSRLGSGKDRYGPLYCYKDTGRTLWQGSTETEICYAWYFCWRKGRGTPKITKPG
ncbi:hypothetical protein BU16DRAFT_539732 [Lophium mytilinum]|uniref:Uncharacterized protein n=1 Tax=Lophium mytilinum TaxID=390894 RepID=A0A6A6QPW2_9PEZI|nr:hypothetical protein BU16DRAFT_539732 [Lophium mytilinum]